MQATTDEALIAQVAAGDKLAMRTLFTRHQVRVFRFLCGVIGDRGKAEDLLADAFIAIWRLAGRLEGRSSVSTFVLAIARHKVPSTLRRPHDAELDEEAAAEIQDGAADPEIPARQQSKGEILRACLAGLSAEHREIVDLLYYQEKSLEECAQIIGIPEDAVKARLHRARKRLAWMAKRKGFDRARSVLNTNESDGTRAPADFLAFYVTGKLPPAEMRRIELALAEDEALRRELALVEEEHIATVQANEGLGLPSAHAVARFYSSLDAEPAPTAPRTPAKDGFVRIGELLQSLAPRQMAYAGIAAALLVLAQAGYIGMLLREPGGEGVRQASVDGSTGGEASFAMLAFMPEARFAEISRLLAATHAIIVDGPRAGDFYKVRLGGRDMPKADRDAVIARLGAEKALIRFVAPSQ